MSASAKKFILADRRDCAIAKELVLSDQRDCQRAPHWSHSIEWRPGRWDPLSNAPIGTCTEVRGRDKSGKLIEQMHWANDTTGESQPSYTGWFVAVKDDHGKVLLYSSVEPVEWQPITAKPEPE